MIANLDNTAPDSFPAVSTALDEPNGLLAAGGDLSPERLLQAYQRGIFPWFGNEDPILWWSPDPRAVFIPGEIHCSRRLRRKLRNSHYRMSLNQAFEQVIQHCAAPRKNEPETWLHGPMQLAYIRLHQLGYAHSIEIWTDDGSLAGGIYGVALGQVFFAESMFSGHTDGSKIALLKLDEVLLANDVRLIDTQMMTPHLRSLGAVEWPRSRFIDAITDLIREQPAYHDSTDNQAL